MPTFRLKNLNVSLVDPNAIKVQTPQFCTLGTTTIWSNQPWCCGFVSPWTCHVLISPRTCQVWISPDTCRFNVSPFDPCGVISRDPCGAISPVVQRPDTVLVNPADELAQLEAMRGQLEELMHAIDERGVQLQQQARPQTREEVEMLEEQLKAALEEIQAMKKDMG